MRIEKIIQTIRRRQYRLQKKSSAAVLEEGDNRSSANDEYYRGGADALRRLLADLEPLLCPFCGTKPVIDWDTKQPNGEWGAMHISHAEECYLALITGAQTHAGGSVEAWYRRHGS